MTYTQLQLALAVPVDLHGQKIGYRFISPGFCEPLGDFSSFREEPFGIPPFRLVALGSLHFHQQSCPTENLSFRCAPMPFCNLCRPCIDNQVGQPVASQVECRASDIALALEPFEIDRLGRLTGNSRSIIAYRHYCGASILCYETRLLDTGQSICCTPCY